VRSLSAWAVVLVVGCSGGELDSRATLASAQALPDSGLQIPADSEALPAEWTVAEDTAANGEVTTASVQLPASRTIEGLPGSSSTRLILRCLDGRVAAFIAASDSGSDTDSITMATSVRVELDSAPSCE
jgi:hypothetical protein